MRVDLSHKGRGKKEPLQPKLSMLQSTRASHAPTFFVHRGSVRQLRLKERERGGVELPVEGCAIEIARACIGLNLMPVLPKKRAGPKPRSKNCVDPVCP